MTQIAFLTLFLGLTLGPQTVELTVTGPASAVEILLDGAPVGRLTGPPWKGTIDFGPALQPHELVARALDEDGGEIARVRQWVNLPRPPAEVELVVENGPEGRPQAVRYAWQSLTGEAPSAIDITLDGRPLVPEPGNRVRLPATDPATVHVLSVQLTFYGALVARRDLAFGGDLGEEVSTELTAVLVRLKKGQTLPPPARLRGWFLQHGKPLPVVAVEEGPAQLLVVRGAGVAKVLAPLAIGGNRAGVSIEDLSPDLVEDRSRELPLGAGDQIGFIWPQAKASTGNGAPTELFDASRLYDTGGRGVLWHLVNVVQEGGRGPQRLADAVAVAALLALYKNQRRAILLVFDDRDTDASRSDAALVRGYLESIRVPLAVWTPGRGKGPAAAAWGRVETVGTMKEMRAAFERLKENLDAQRIIWVGGRHLPQSITLSPEAAAVVELAR